MEEETICSDCKNTGRVKEKDGSFHTCFKCLAAGRLNQHSDKLREPDRRIRI